MLKKIAVVVTGASLCCSVLGQNIEGVNARIDAMGGSGACTDIAWTIHKPAGIYQFPNQVQASAINAEIWGLGQTFGSIIGITQVTQNLFLGFSMNNRMEMPFSFYRDAALLLDATHISPTDNAENYPNYPKVNICLKVNDNMQFGIGAYFEGMSYTHDETKKFVYTANAGIDSISVDCDREQQGKMVRNDGGVLEARITIGATTINPLIKAGIPRIGGTETISQLAAVSAALAANPADAQVTVTNGDYSWNALQGRLLSGGSNAWTVTSRALIVGGIFLTNKRYQLNKTIDEKSFILNTDGSKFDSTVVSVDSSFSDRDWKMVDWWFSVVPTYADGFYFAPEYDGGLGLFTGKDPHFASDTSFMYTYHNFRLGMEKYAKKVGWFDEVAFRGGIAAYWVKEFRHIVEKDWETTDSKESLPWQSYFWGADFTRKEAKMTGGIGLKKGRGTLDVSVDFLKWASTGILSGPAAALATFTVDFGKTRQ
ncbi:MAG: hypothetical protein JW768_05640 [Chitinispirillaceae bacterium]|nr:hypothetical protein [Chitinispirillaceae bacterium]